MPVNLNNATVQGYVVSVTENDNNTRVTLAVRDDYRKDDDTIERTYFLPITFFGVQGVNLAKLVSKGAFLTVDYKVTSYKPQDNEYHVLSLLGTSFYLMPQSNSNSTTDKQSNNRNRVKGANNKSRPNNNNNRKTNRNTRVEIDEEDDDDWGEAPPW